MQLIPEEIFFGLRKYAVIEEESRFALETFTGFMLQETIINLCMLFEESTAFKEWQWNELKKITTLAPLIICATSTGHNRRTETLSIKFVFQTK